MSLGPPGASLNPEEADNFEDVSRAGSLHSRERLTGHRLRSSSPSKVRVAKTTILHALRLNPPFTVVQHMSTYWAILEKMRGSKLRLTKFDDEIYDHFKKEFPDFDATATINEDEMKSKAGKERWRNFIMTYEKKIDDYNFGTMLRANPRFEYGEKESIFGE